jgi:hypothetical protein
MLVSQPFAKDCKIHIVIFAEQAYASRLACTNPWFHVSLTGKKILDN